MSFENLDVAGMESPMPISQGDAVMIIEGSRTRIMAMGANDSENDRINTIIFQLNEGRITPEEAVAMVSSIEIGKNDYH